MKRKRIILLTTLFLAITISAYGQDKRIGAFNFQTQQRGHDAEVVFQTREFDRSKHKVDYGNFHNRVDGHVAYGAESPPSVEIASMRFYFDGREIRVPRRLYSDCYNPNFGSSSIKLRFSGNLQVVTVSCRVLMVQAGMKLFGI